MSVPWTTIGASAKAILESTFNGVAATSVVCVPPSGTSKTLKAMIVNQLVRTRREGLRVDEAGLLDRHTIEVVFKTADITTAGITITPEWYFTIGGVRYDFSVREPFAEKELTPMASALNVFTRFFVRRAEELSNTTSQASSGDAFKFGDL